MGFRREIDDSVDVVVLDHPLDGAASQMSPRTKV